MAYVTRIFRRCVQDNKFWWHWRPDCNIWKSAWSMKRRGWTFVYVTKHDGSRPLDYWLCPGCHALDDRIRTKAFPYCTKKIVPLPGKSTPATITGVPAHLYVTVHPSVGPDYQVQIY